MIHSVFSDDYVTVTHEPEAGLYVYARTATPYPSMEALRAHHTALEDTLDALSTGADTLLIDIREATPRNDSAFESEITEAVGSMFAQFASYAFLVKTAVGSLQLRRLSSSNGIRAAAIFTDEAAARRYLAARRK
jgi:hypothetical protein